MCDCCSKCRIRQILLSEPSKNTGNLHDPVQMRLDYSVKSRWMRRFHKVCWCRREAEDGGHSLEERAWCQWFDWTVVYVQAVVPHAPTILESVGASLLWTFGGFLEHMVEMAKRLDSTLFGKYIHDRSLSLLHSEELGSGLQAGDGWELGAVIQAPDQT